MADTEDLSLGSPHQRVTETSFGGDNDGYLVVPADEREEVQHQPSKSADLPFRAAKQPGLITRIGRGVKSAVGGAIGGAINIFVGTCLNLILLA